MKDLNYALPVDRDALAAHYKDVEAFQTSRANSVRRLSRVMIAVTTVALLGNLAQALTIAGMLPLVRIQPVFLWVRADGSVDSAVSMSRLPATQIQAVVNAALWEYVRLREGYTPDTARYAYDVVSNFSSPKVRLQYQEFFNYPNPASPQVTIGKRGAVEIAHISSVDIGPTLQQVRFKRTVTMDGRAPIVTTWTATVGYATVDNMQASLRLTNPGGVLVTSYQATEDSAPTTTISGAAP